MKQITDETIDYVSLLAKLDLSAVEKEEAKQDLTKMLTYIEQLNELDTTNVEPMSHILPVENVLREDIVTNSDNSAMVLANAPGVKDGMYKVPRTVE